MAKTWVLVAGAVVLLIGMQAAVTLSMMSRMASLEQALQARAAAPAAGTAERTEVSIGTLPVLGPAGAPVTIVEFSDYECPFCAAAEPIMQELLRRYPTQVRLAYRDLPLTNIHPYAATAAHAARCAADQGQFWPYHHRLLAGGPDVRRQQVSPEALADHARALKLDLTVFDQCMDSQKHRAAIEADMKDARRLGLTGTPAFFVNGRKLTGARPLEEFIAIVEEELALLTR